MEKEGENERGRVACPKMYPFILNIGTLKCLFVITIRTSGLYIKQCKPRGRRFIS